MKVIDKLRGLIKRKKKPRGIDVLYVCDKKACVTGCLNAECRYTTEIAHAINFELWYPGGCYIEK